MSTTIGRALAALAFALLPGAVSYVLGLRLRRCPDDPALPERLLKQRQLVFQLGVVSFGVFLAWLHAEAVWGLPLMLVATFALGFPARRALFAEGWGLGAYLVHVARFSLASVGFWALLAAAPLVAGLGAPAAALVAAALVAWGLLYGPLFAFFVGAQPLARPDLEPRFASILGRATAPAPRLLVAGHPQARWANAFALPSLFGPGVLFTRTLLEAFEAEEIEGVYAHELAHIEHHDRARLVRASIAVLVLAPIAAWAVPRVATLLTFGEWLPWLWPLLVLVGLAVRMARHQAHEAESDRRAVELLGGDPEPLARALIKLHAIGRLPRRFEARMEKGASHPSLARRLQVLRGSSGATAAAPEATVLETARPGSVVILESDRGHWLEGVPAEAPRDAGLRERAARARSIAYSELSGLHVQVGWTGRARLKATDRSGKAWAEPLRAEDVARAQAALDGIDARLGAVPSSVPHQPAAVLLCFAVCVAGLLAGRVGVYLLPALVGVFGPTGPVLVAVGVAALAEVAGSAPVTPLGLAASLTATWALPAAALACLALGILRLRRGDPAPARPAFAAGALLALSAALLGTGMGLGALQAPRLLRLHLLASDRPGAGIALVTLAALLAAMRRPAVAGGLAFAGLALLTIGSATFAARVVRDPLLASAPLLRVQDRVAPELARVELPALAIEARLSPDGGAWAVRERVADPEREDDAALSFRVGRFGGPSRAIAAADLVLLGGDRALRVTPGVSAFRLEIFPLSGGTASWSVALPRLAGPRLDAGPDDAWAVSGWSYDERRFVIATGRVGTPAVERRDLGGASPAGALPQYVAGAGQTLVLTRRVQAGPFWIAAAMLGVPATSVDLGWLGQRSIATTPLDVRCVARHAERDFVCTASHAACSRFFRLAEGQRTLEPLGQLAERVYWEQAAPRGRLCVRLASGHYAELDFEAGTASRLLFDEGRLVTSLAFGNEHMAALSHAGERARLTLHPLP